MPSLTPCGHILLSTMFKACDFVLVGNKIIAIKRIITIMKTI